MNITFRQGIVKAFLTLGAPDFLTFNSGTNCIDMTPQGVDVLVTAAFSTVNYLIREMSPQTSAWGPLVWNTTWGVNPGGFTSNLYWDISLATGQVTRGFTP